MSNLEERNVWTRQETWALIQCIETRPILWDFTLKEYQNKVKKEEEFKEVAAIIKSKSVADIKRKLHALRSQHSGERMKIKKKKSGSGADENYVPKWEFFTALNFMFKDAGSAGSVVDSITTLNAENGGDDAEYCPPGDVGTSLIAPDQIPANQKAKKRKREKEDSCLQLAYNLLNTQTEKEDSTTIFSKYVAEKLNQFDPCTKAVLTQKINTLIFETEMSCLSNFGRAPNVPSLSQNVSPSPTPTATPPTPPPPPQYSPNKVREAINELKDYLII